MAQDHSNIIDPTTPDKDTQKVPIQQQEPVKTEPLPQEIDSTLDVAPTPQKQVNMKKRAEQQHYHEKINILKYQLEKSQQQYNDEHQAHLRFVKERESMDHHIQHQISLAKQQLDHLRRAMPEGRQLRTSRSHHSLINDKQQQKHPMYSLEREEEEGVTAQDNRYDDARQRWMEAYYRYYNYYYRPCNDYYYYNEKRKTNDYYWDTDRYKPLYYGTKKGGKGADERRESAYYRVWR
ncbi:hypothetical protein K501DRAFT_289710 [Backusella circina FSU 941]|nr:hypothetical protein K501DRAFT_289710 [Backusella circina FSU 941]